MEILLLDESPIIAVFLTSASMFACVMGYHITAIIFAVILLFMIFFYRHYPIEERHPDNTIVSPANGVITNLRIVEDHVYISIFLSPFNVHTQVYPVNGTVVKRVYDETGKFGLATDIDKCRDNEKKIHYILMGNNKVLKITQIAGFLPRRIASSDKILEKVQANQYLGIIKFGSRVDMLFPVSKNFELFVRKGDVVNPGDIIGRFM